MVPLFPSILRRLAGRSAGGVRAGALVLVAALLAGTLTVADQAPSAAYAAGVRVDLRVLVLSDGSASVDALAAALDREGVPYDRVDLTDQGRPTIDAGFLADAAATPRRGRYQAIIAHDAELLQATEAERTALADYQRAFGVRRVDAYVWPTAALGLGVPEGSPAIVTGSMDGATATATAAGTAGGFGYLDGPVPFQDGSWGYVAQPVAGAPYTSLVDVSVPSAEAPRGAWRGSLIGVYSHADGREEMVITATANQHQLQSTALAHGIITWATAGLHLGVWRNYFSVHVDDVLLPDDRWSIEHDCTVGDDCPEGVTATDIRMTADDVTFLREWQRTRSFKLDLAFNAGGSVEAISQNGSDPLTDALLADRTEYRWINHTYAHPNLGCTKDHSVTPWRCMTDASGQVVWMDEAEIARQIALNQEWAVANGIPMDPTELVTGEHSGLRVLPQHGVDNPNLAPALATTGIEVIASDNSRESAQRPVGAAVTLPRYPMNIFYNVGTEAEEVDEYNWIYTSRTAGGSGLCEDFPETTTCIAPLDLQTGFDEVIVPLEASIAMSHVLRNDPRPHFAHQSNLAEDRILYPVVDEVLARYRSMFSAATPLVMPTMTEAAEVLARQDRWRDLTASSSQAVQAYTLDGVLHVESTTSALVPVTAPVGTTIAGAPFGEVYGGEQSGWVAVEPSPPPTTTTTAPPTTTTTAAPTTTTTAPPTTTTTAAPTTTTTAPPTTSTTVRPTPPTTQPPRPSRSGYWLIGADGKVYGFGDVARLVWDVAMRAGERAVDIEPTPTGRGYWVVTAWGRVIATGDAAGDLGNAGRLEGGERVTSISATPTGRGYWLFTSTGRVIPKGDARRGLGDMSHVPLNGPVLDSVATPTGEGYYMVASDGGVFAFGDAEFRGSMGGRPLNEPVRSLAPDPDGDGYWLVAGDGGIFAFGADFRGSVPGELRPGQRLNQPVVGMVPYGTGYLMVASDGGVFNFSGKPFNGSLGSNPPGVPVVGVAAVPDR